MPLTTIPLKFKLAKIYHKNTLSQNLTILLHDFLVLTKHTDNFLVNAFIERLLR